MRASYAGRTNVQTISMGHAAFALQAGDENADQRGEHLPDEVMETLQPRVRQMLASPQDVANAVLFAVSQPIYLNVAEIVVRPPKQLQF